jgi:alpha-L-fucosidase
LHHLHLPGLAGKVRFAQLLNDGAEVAVERHAGDGTSPIDPPGQAPDTVTIRLPVVRPDVLVPVVELFLDD